MSAAAVTVIGDALLDVLATPHGSIRHGADVAAAIRTAPGGQGANVAVRLARRGVRVALVSALADDAAGRIVREALEADGIALEAVPTERTGTVVVVRSSGGERTMLSDRRRFAGALPLASLPESGWAVVSGYLLTEPDAGAVVERIRAATRRRALLGCAVEDAGLRAWREAALALRPDVVIVNRDEADRLGPESPFDGLVVTHADGAAARIAGVRGSVRATHAPPAADTTGAGDAFAAAFLAEVIAAGWPPGRASIDRALSEAAALASSVAGVVGAQAAVPGETGGVLRP